MKLIITKTLADILKDKKGKLSKFYKVDKKLPS